MSYRQYNVGYYDDRGRLCEAYVTPVPTRAQAEKRLAKLIKSGGASYWLKDGIGVGKAPPFLISRLILDWEKEDF